MIDKDYYKHGQDAVFLPGIIHGCENEVYILCYNENGGYNSNGCFDIDIVDKAGIIELFKESNGEYNIFFAMLPDKFQGRWRYCDNTMSEDFEEYKNVYNKANFISGLDGNYEDEMNFLVSWAEN